LYIIQGIQILRYIFVRDTGKYYTLYLVTLFQAADILIFVCRLYSYQNISGKGCQVLLPVYPD